jgi:divalent metal cation (Fe/Co/Zn/Cd) transporter
MRNAFSIILYVIAGVLLYCVAVFGFMNEPQAGAKWGIMLGFAALAILILAGGLALRKFSNWKTHTGIVFLSSAGVTTFLAFVFACLLMDDNLRMLMHSDSLAHFSDYLTGAGVTAGFAVLGLLLLKSDKSSAGQVAAAETEKPGG